MRSTLLFVALSLVPGWAAAAGPNPFLGDWALTLPTGGAGWLGVDEKDGQLQASLLWGGGSVFPLDGAKLDGDRLLLTRIREGKRKQDDKMVAFKITQTLTATLDGNTLKMTTVDVNDKGKEMNKAELVGQRQPAMPPAPDLAKVQFGPSVVLFNGRDLGGWKPTNDDLPNGWSVQEGVLINRQKHEEGQPHQRYTNLRTEREFEDFNLTLETRVPENGNSGVYLRGIYEVQVCDSFGKPLDPHNMGGVYSRICPTVSAEKPAGQWQTLDITLVDRHVTVILNGVKVVDNQPVRGCTGGALWSDPLRPGPLFLQGDHTDVDYRNILLRPVVR